MCALIASDVYARRTVLKSLLAHHSLSPAAVSTTLTTEEEEEKEEEVKEANGEDTGFGLNLCVLVNVNVLDT